MRPKKTVITLSKPTIEDIIDYGNRSLKTSLDEWNKRSAAGTGWTTTPERKMLQNLCGKVGECCWYCAFLEQYPDLTLPDFTVYTKEQKSWAEDMSSQKGNFTVGIKTKELQDAQKFTPSIIFQDRDKKVFGKNIKSNQYISMVIADLNVENARTPYPRALMNNVKGKILFCVPVPWLHDHKLFAPDDHHHEGKLAVRWNKHFVDERDGKEYDSILDVVNKHYNGNMDILWQL